jgi:hypothetical protein
MWALLLTPATSLLRKIIDVAAAKATMTIPAFGCNHATTEIPLR